jgi:hypothetical protein
MIDFVDGVRLPSGDGSIAPVTILDAQGRVVDVLSAVEFRRTHPRAGTARYAGPARRRQR